MNYNVLVSMLYLFSVSFANSDIESFTQCMSTQVFSYTKSFQIIFAPNSSLYSYLLETKKQNPRFVNDSGSNPLLILTPFHESEIQSAILCSRKHGLQVRVRSGGHDYEGLSYLCSTPFVIIDLINLRLIEVDIESETAWVQSGATLGELYYAIAEKSKIHGFPAGLCPTVGVGGHFSGGGFGTMVRKFGLAADQVVDAYLVDVNGRVLDRKRMGEDLFWAIRGGGGASFGIILSWKVKLVRVPPTVTAFNVPKTIEEGATQLVHKWQRIAHKLPENLFLRIIIQNVGNDKDKMVQASFNSLFLGEIDKLIPLMNKNFPELGLQAEDCTEMSWIESTIDFSGFPRGSPFSVLLDKNLMYKTNFKSKSDFVTQPIPEEALVGIWNRFLAEEMVFMIMDPFGGRMNEISESEIPFPHRSGNLYNIQYLVKWEVDRIEESAKHVHWIRMLYRYMRPYVSKSPRTAYLNYRDIDLGSNEKNKRSSYAEASVWGMKYFKGNFERLVKVKSQVDPNNFFRNEQSIPSLYSSSQ